MQPAPCYRYEIQLTPAVAFNPYYKIPDQPPRPQLSPLRPDSLWAQLERLLIKARMARDSINPAGVDQYLAKVSAGAYPSVCALRMAIDPAAYGRVSVWFYDPSGRSRFQRDPGDVTDQALSPGLTDHADDGHKIGDTWKWTGRVPAEALPLSIFKEGSSIRATLEPACRSADLPA